TRCSRMTNACSMIWSSSGVPTGLSEALPLIMVRDVDMGTSFRNWRQPSLEGGPSGDSDDRHPPPLARMTVRSGDAWRTGVQSTRSKPRHSLEDRGLSGHVADNVGRHLVMKLCCVWRCTVGHQ